MGKRKKKKSKITKRKWEVTVWLNCEQRIGVPPENIERRMLAHCQAHNVEEYPDQVQVRDFRTNKKKWGHWYLYCYFVPVEGTVDVVDAAPIQTSRRGAEWLELVKHHFDVFGMPWRMREYPYAAMISGGRAAVEKLLEAVESFVDKIKPDPGTVERFHLQLHRAWRSLDNYYKTVAIPDQKQARIALDTTVYILHELIYDIGESLRLVPRKKYGR
jgi:hypothetical protein